MRQDVGRCKAKVVRGPREVRCLPLIRTGAGVFIRESSDKASILWVRRGNMERKRERMRCLHGDVDDEQQCSKCGNITESL